MTNKAKAKGSQFERDVVAYFNANGFPLVERRYGAGALKDAGDINGIQAVVECKSLAKITLASIMDETEVEIENSKFDTGFAIIKRRGKSVDKAYLVIQLDRALPLLKDAGF